ncbi:hypothetical protein N7537_002368 [Penicillium hordei]|uniref:Uncharacterized protein n=1 Tax=Penicillium hordei TaxID=40994 RepID=A0AAD6EH69_9EURO|nr:uncharacterized protein N7537_002368 [Penicillium hordei]KAJ5617254.1 hypothetical protein N7537_002368 [Penicillium hordei]
MEWTDNLNQNDRFLVIELSLRSRGVYEVFLLVRIKDESIPIYRDNSQVLKKVEAQFIPRELLDMAVHYNE